jgi:hypothetical protein
MIFRNSRVVDFDVLLGAANPLSAAAAATLPVDDALYGLCEAVLSQGPPAQAPAPRRHRIRGARTPRLVVSLAIVVAAAIVALSVDGVFAGRSETAWGAELVHFAEASPLILLEQAGWQVDYANEDSAQVGEMHFTSGPIPAPSAGATSPAEDLTTDAALFWRSGSLSSWMADRASSADVITTAPVLGTTANVYQYAGGQPGRQQITALWEYGGQVLEFSAAAADIAAFESLLASLRQVDVDTWLSALPASVVKTADRTAVIASMLQGVTLPPGFSPSSISGAGLTSDRYQLGATVAGTVACTWFKLWSDARSSGDSAGAQQAIAAMATAKNWPILQEMSNSGAYPQILEAFAAAMPSGLWSGRPLDGDVNSGLGCPALGVPLPEPPGTGPQSGTGFQPAPVVSGG